MFCKIETNNIIYRKKIKNKKYEQFIIDLFE
jgi:hypothetical protein